MNKPTNDIPQEKPPATKSRFSTVKEIFAAIIFVFVFFIGLTMANIIGSDELYFSKSIKVNIELAIRKKANLKIVKHIYSNRKLESKNILDIIKTKDRYLNTIQLTTILKDLLEDHYTDSLSVVDDWYIERINALIIEHNQINPFDKLDLSQKSMFENVRFKLDSNYLTISNDINKIVDDLDEKNNLVTEYLNRSNQSFYISIIALILTLAFSSYQIFQSKSLKAKYIQKILTEINSNNEDINEANNSD